MSTINSYSLGKDTWAWIKNKMDLKSKFEFLKILISVYKDRMQSAVDLKYDSKTINCINYMNGVEEATAFAIAYLFKVSATDINEILSMRHSENVLYAKIVQVITKAAA